MAKLRDKKSWVQNHGMGESHVATRDTHVRTVRWMRNKYQLYLHLCVFWIPFATGADFIQMHIQNLQLFCKKPYIVPYHLLSPTCKTGILV